MDASPHTPRHVASHGHDLGAGCLTEEQIFLHSEGLLEGDEARSAAAHLRSCEACALRYRAELEFTVELRGLPAPSPSPALSRSVVGRIRRARVGRPATWWWAVAIVFLLGSGARWFVVGDLSPAKAVESLVLFLWDGAVSTFRFLVVLGDLETWAGLGRVGLGVLEAISGSPALLAASVAAAVVVAVATNVAIWSVARRALAGR